ncbi:MAG: hypothetical protein JST73_02840 [Actinobacteria bacterium]|nr:hypothetical protein [Actinomycetota bacterium]
MNANELVVGEPRVGWLIGADADADAEAEGTMLRDTGDAIELTVPLVDHLVGGSKRRWWSRGINFGDDPDRTKFDYAPPRIMKFQDHLGVVILVGCRATGSNARNGVGQGRIVANFAVLGASTHDYESVNGMRTEIPALRDWTGITGLEWDTEDDDEGRAQVLNVRVVSLPSTRLASDLDLTMKSMWSSERDGGRFTIDQSLILETNAEDPRPWDEHLQLHSAVLDLVSIAAWRPLGYARINVNRTDDPRRDLQGEPRGPRWAPVASRRLLPDIPDEKIPRFLFRFADLDEVAIQRWITMRNMHSTAIGSILNVLRSDKPWSRAGVVEGGIALEALGYDIELMDHDGTNLNDHRQLPFHQAVANVAGDLVFEPFDDIEGWKQRTRDVHRALKHPDRADPDSLDAINTHRETLLVMRCWIAGKLGVSAVSIENGLRLDPLNSPFAWAD